MAKAQQTAAVRPDIATPELIGLMIGTARTLEHVDPDPESQRRVLAVLRDGLRYAQRA
ncbi:hypothetical protein [Micromonospora sp. LOL_023]|uniref:SbtR family transcriptional regulator n=1 Tax=Micromonospora sp. LOL_023 TaxID=3345418 RepID=UPI003A8C7086